MRTNMFFYYFITGFLFSIIFQQIGITEEIYNIGNRREIFIDNKLIDKLENILFKLCEPIPAEKVLYFDKPWEGKHSGYVTLIHDQDIYRLYYRGLPVSKADGSNAEVTCYAESTDGIHFTKPSLGLFEIAGSKDNNVILANDPPFSHNFAPFIDEKPNIPKEERYKAVAGTFDSGLYTFVSPDGIRWRKLSEKPILKGASWKEFAFDSQNVVFWSILEQKYILYFRTWNGPNQEYRWVSRTTSSDFLNWEKPVVMDKGNAPWEHIYTNQTIPYFNAPHIYVSLSARFVPGCKVLSDEEIQSIGVEKDYSHDCSDVIFMSSRGGNLYNRFFLNAFLKPEYPIENWVSRTNYPVRGIVPVGDYQMAFYIQKNYAQDTAYIQRYLLRLDGFSCLSAGYTEGIFTTVPIIFKGNNLFLNFATSAVGYVNVEVQDISGKPLSGYEFDNSIPLKGNRINFKVSWNSTDNLSSLQETPIRLSFKMKDADLYAIQFK
ncbi:MAG TPA: hypothetical protein PLJ10_03680 [Candidatus Hydrogenedens sp.]|nr:hypothetical protein [Candidatus Hydrogenedens sp.]